jgi:hypothetical protein
MFRSKKKKDLEKQFLSYFNIEANEKSTTMIADISNEDVKKWLYGITHVIQSSFGKHPEIKNYLMGEMTIGGQKIEFSFLKTFGTGPHYLRIKAEEENEKLKIRVKELEEKLNGLQH